MHCIKRGVIVDKRGALFDKRGPLFAQRGGSLKAVTRCREGRTHCKINHALEYSNGNSNTRYANNNTLMKRV